MIVNRNVTDNLKRIATIKNRDARITATRALFLDNNPIATLVQYTYHPKVVFYPFEAEFGSELNEPEVVEEGPMYRSIRSLKYLMTSHSPTVSVEKRHSIFLGMLSSVKRDDAALLRSVVLDRKLPYKTLGEEFFREAVPELFLVEEEKEAA